MLSMHAGERGRQTLMFSATVRTHHSLTAFSDGQSPRGQSIKLTKAVISSISSVIEFTKVRAKECSSV